MLEPGSVIMEIVPSEDELLVEARIRPSDIAFVHVGQEALVKISAYDFSIYGGLHATVARISADTIPDERGEPWFIVRVRATRMSLGDADRPLPISSGIHRDGRYRYWPTDDLAVSSEADPEGDRPRDDRALSGAPGRAGKEDLEPMPDAKNEPAKLTVRAAEPEATGMPPLYQRVRPIEPGRHSDWGIADLRSYDFAAKTRAIPITGAEFPTAARDYPICFATSDADGSRPGRPAPLREPVRRRQGHLARRRVPARLSAPLSFPDRPVARRRDA